MAPDLPPLVQRTLQRLIAAFAPERVILFGSYAKGTVRARATSTCSSSPTWTAARTCTSDAPASWPADCFPPVDVVIVTPAEVAEAWTAKSPFLLSILGSGVPIYPASAAGPG